MSRRPLILLALACAAAACAVLVWLVAFVLPFGGHLDGRSLQTFTGVARPHLTPSIEGIALLAGPWPLALGGVALIALALARGRRLMAAVVPAILLSANLATQLLKPALADPRVIDVRGVDVVFTGSWPSGHSTAAMSLALCLVLVVGPRLRPLAALLGAGYAIAVGYALVVLGSHLASDVFGGFLVAATFTLLGAAALAGLEGRWPASVPRPLPPPSPLAASVVAAFACGALACVAFVLVLRDPGGMLDALGHPVAVLAGIGIAGLGLTLTAGLARMLRG